MLLDFRGTEKSSSCRGRNLLQREHLKSTKKKQYRMSRCHRVIQRTTRFSLPIGRSSEEPHHYPPFVQNTRYKKFPKGWNRHATQLAFTVYEYRNKDSRTLSRFQSLRTTPANEMMSDTQSSQRSCSYLGLLPEHESIKNKF